MTVTIKITTIKMTVDSSLLTLLFSTVTVYGEIRAANFTIYGLWGNDLEPIFFHVLGNLKFSIKYGENSIW